PELAQVDPDVRAQDLHLVRTELRAGKIHRFARVVEEERTHRALVAGEQVRQDVFVRHRRGILPANYTLAATGSSTSSAVGPCSRTCCTRSPSSKARRNAVTTLASKREPASLVITSAAKRGSYAFW